MNIAEFAHKWGRATPDHPAVALGADVVFSYRVLSARVAGLAAGLVATGHRHGDRVAILMTNSVHYLECMLACWHAGLACVPVNAKLHPSEIEFILEQSGATTVFVSPTLSSALPTDALDAIAVPSAAYEALVTAPPIPREETSPDDLAWLFYTSGTTGRPKGAMITHRNLLFACHCYALDVDPHPPWSAILHPAPFSHGSGLYGLAHLMKGSCQVMPASGGFNADEIFDLIEAWPDCVFFAAPTMINTLTRHPQERNVSNLKCVVFGGAPMLLADIKAFLSRFGPRLAQLYGQGEAPMTITGLSTATFADTQNPDWERRIASAGMPQSGVEVRIVDARGNTVPEGESGEIICRSDAVIPGYWQNPEATANALRDGWLWTGDIGRLDADGYLTLTDRSKDMIISGGSNIYPREVEEVLAQHEQVAEVSVIGTPDAKWGEIVVAFIVPETGQEPSTKELDALCLASIARFKRPKHYRFIEGLPKNNYGKILKTRLREMEMSRSDAAV
ncbi:MAG: long-chain fatty acid--CoA ligase [Pseudomonadota bacterium]